MKTCEHEWYYSWDDKRFRCDSCGLWEATRTVPWEELNLVERWRREADRAAEDARRSRGDDWPKGSRYDIMGV